MFGGQWSEGTLITVSPSQGSLSLCWSVTLDTDLSPPSTGPVVVMVTGVRRS